MEATADGQYREKRRGPGPGMIILRVVGLLLAVLLGAGIWLWSIEAPETVRPWLYQKGTYLGPADAPISPTVDGDLGSRVRLQGQ